MSEPWSSIKHIVVLMMENRAFDNMLGWLYAPDNEPPGTRGQSFEGLAGKNLSNPVPEAYGGGFAVPETTVDMIAPHPNPNEPYVPVYTRLFGLSPPPDPIPNTTATPTMDGFVADYASTRPTTRRPTTSSRWNSLHGLANGCPPLFYSGALPSSLIVIVS